MRRKLFFLASAILAFALVYRAMSFTPELVSFSGPTMGTTYTVKFYTTENIQAPWSIKADVDAVLLHVNKLMSTYDTESEISRFNQTSANTSMQISDEFAYVLDKALLISSMSAGEYDVTVGPLVNLWGFGPGKHSDEVPTDEAIDLAKQRVGYEYLQLDNRTLSKQKDIYVDLSSIAKGYGVDAVAQKLASLGIHSYLVEVGGEIQAQGVKPDGSPWQVAIESPAGGHNIVQKIIDANDMAIATSGDYRNYFEKQGVRYSHTISPVTGRPITHRLVSVTIIDKTATMADGLATAITVLGPEKGLAFAQQHGIAAYMLVKQDFGFEELVSSAFEPYLH